MFVYIFFCLAKRTFRQSGVTDEIIVAPSDDEVNELVDEAHSRVYKRTRKGSSEMSKTSTLLIVGKVNDLHLGDDINSSNAVEIKASLHDLKIFGTDHDYMTVIHSMVAKATSKTVPPAGYLCVCQFFVFIIYQRQSELLAILVIVQTIFTFCVYFLHFVLFCMVVFIFIFSSSIVIVTGVVIGVIGVNYCSPCATAQIHCQKCSPCRKLHTPRSTNETTKHVTQNIFLIGGAKHCNSFSLIQNHGGLQNIGNSCYENCIIQTLASSTKFYEMLSAHHLQNKHNYNHSANCVTCQIFFVARNIKHGKKTNCRHLHNAVSNKNRDWSFGQQHDPRVYLRLLFQLTETENPSNDWSPTLPCSVLQKTFEVILHIKTTCRNCNHTHSDFQHVFEFIVSPTNSNLQQAIDNLSKPTNIPDYLCNACHQRCFVSQTKV